MKTHHLQPRALTLAASFAAMILAFGLSGAPAQAASTETAARQATVYVGLGDSFAAGTGGDKLAKGRRMNESIGARRRGAPLARREEGAYSSYVTDEQRSQGG